MVAREWPPENAGFAVVIAHARGNRGVHVGARGFDSLIGVSLDMRRGPECVAIAAVKGSHGVTETGCCQTHATSIATFPNDLVSSDLPYSFDDPAFLPAKKSAAVCPEWPQGGSVRIRVSGALRVTDCLALRPR